MVKQRSLIEDFCGGKEEMGMELEVWKEISRNLKDM